VATSMPKATATALEEMAAAKDKAKAAKQAQSDL
jgi:hypothetical protein